MTTLQLTQLRRREVQALHAAISTRNWNAVEVAANELRDKIDAVLLEASRGV